MACEVTTTCGTVTGTVDSKTNARRFLGIPYATSKRFQLPEAIEHGDIDCSKRGPTCPQVPVQFFRALTGRPPKIAELPPGCSEEKCLNLNVVVPEGDGPFPVFVFFHGGAFAMGSNGDVFLHSLSKSKLVVQHKVAVVCPNYRLAALGFLRLPDVPANLGVRDALTALQWVHREGPAFGLDTSCVMVGGESAGAMLTGALLRSPAAKGLFHKAFLMSGTPKQVVPMDDAEALGKDFLKNSRLLDLQKATTLELLQATARWTSGGAMPFQPCADGEVITDEIQVSCDILTGVTDNEYLLFMPHGVPTPTFNNAVAKFKHSLCETGLDCSPTDDEVNAIVASVQKQYKVSFGRQVARRLNSIMVFEGPCLLGARWMAEKNNVYLYRNMLGPAHAGELGYIFGAWNRDGINRWLAGLSLLRPNSNVPLGQPMEELWSATVSEFLRTGVPGPGWPRFCPDQPQATSLAPDGARPIAAFSETVDLFVGVSQRARRPFGVKVVKEDRHASL